MFCFLAIKTQAQTANQKKALETGQKAIELVDEGKFDEGIKLLEEAQQLDPENYQYPYEIGYAYYTKGDNKKALKYFNDLLKYKGINDQVYQMLGNVYDYLSDSAKAMKAYDDGLKKFPKSGKLFLEKGNVLYSKQHYIEALDFYEKGIEAEPEFPSNYFRAAKIYCNSSEAVWGIIYGEIFMNLERNSKRTEEISKLLYDTYKAKIKVTSDTSMEVHFSKNNVISADNLKNGKLKLPYGSTVYEPILLLSLALGKKVIDMESLCHARYSFVEYYYKFPAAKEYPNILFEYQKKIKDAGYFDVYNRWLLMKGDEKAFDDWILTRGDDFKKFAKWFGDNPLELNEKHFFSRFQY